MKASLPTLLVVLAGALQAQENRIIKATVVDAGNKPLSGATVYLDGDEADVRSGKDGSLTLQAPNAEATLVVRKPGYVPASIKVPQGGEVNAGTAQLRQIKSDEDREAVKAIDLQLYPRLAGFYDRKARYKQASFLTPDEVQRSAGTVTDIIRQKQGFHEMCIGNRQGGLDCGKKSNRGPSTIYGSGSPGNAVQQMCFARVWTDDVGPERTLDEIHLNEILAIEAYPSAITTPSEFPGGSCVTIRLWMKRAEDRVPVRP